MTRAPPSRLRIAPMREDDRCDCIAKLSFLFLIDECFLELPTGERCIRLPWLGSVESITANHQQCRCHVPHFWAERPSIQQNEGIREGVEAVRRKAKGMKNRLCSLRPISTQHSIPLANCWEH